MFERFSDVARRAVIRAQGEAGELGADEIDLVHLVLGVASVDGIGRQVLEQCGFSLDEARARLLRAAAGVGSSDFVPFTNDSKKALEVARHQAESLGRRDVRPEHVLLGALELEQPRLEALLESQHLSSEDLRAAVMDAVIAEHVAGGSSGRPRPATGASRPGGGGRRGGDASGDARRDRGAGDDRDGDDRDDGDGVRSGDRMGAIRATSRRIAREEELAGAGAGDGVRLVPGSPSVRRASSGSVAIAVCSFCGSDTARGGRLIGGHDGFICQACVGQAAALLARDPAEAARSIASAGSGTSALWEVPGGRVSRVSPMRSWQAAFTAAEEIRDAFWGLFDETEAGGLINVEGGERVAGLHTVLAAASADFVDVQIQADDVEYHSDVAAVVQFELVLSERSAGLLDGIAVFVRDRWLVAWSTLVQVAKLAGVDLDELYPAPVEPAVLGPAASATPRSLPDG